MYVYELNSKLAYPQSKRICLMLQIEIVFNSCIIYFYSWDWFPQDK